MSLRDVHGGRALVLRLLLAELLAKRGEGPLAPRHGVLARPGARFGPAPRVVRSAAAEQETEPR